jgi:hypothetical protein
MTDIRLLSHCFRQSEIKKLAPSSPLVPVDAPPSPKMSPIVRPSHPPSPLSLPPNTNSPIDQGSPSTPPSRPPRLTPAPLVMSSSVDSRQSFQRPRHASSIHNMHVDVPPSPVSRTFSSSPRPPPSPGIIASAPSSPKLLPFSNNRPTTQFPREFFPQPPKPRKSEDSNVGRNSEISPPTLGRNRSLRNKMSLPALRTKSVAGPSRQEEGSSHVPADGRQQNGDLKTVQVKSTDFELIRPIVSQNSPVYTSDDSPRDGPQTVDYGLLRVNSPSQSITSTDLRSPSSVSEFTFPRPPRPNEVNSIEAHRQRELKWMSLMSTVPSSQARKNKKIKRLLFEGVPSSVRYMVWAHLTDSKAKSVQGLYSQLANRGKPLASGEMEMDVRTFFRGQPQLHGAQGPVVSLLRAYLAMAPDLRYQPGEVKPRLTLRLFLTL